MPSESKRGREVLQRQATPEAATPSFEQSADYGHLDVIVPRSAPEWGVEKYAAIHHMPADYLRDVWGLSDGTASGRPAVFMPWRDELGGTLRARAYFEPREDGRQTVKWAYGDTITPPPPYGCGLIAPDAPYIVVGIGEAEAQACHLMGLPCVSVDTPRGYTTTTERCLSRLLPSTPLYLVDWHDRQTDELADTIAELRGSHFRLLDCGSVTRPDGTPCRNPSDVLASSETLEQAAEAMRGIIARAVRYEIGELPPLVSLSDVWENLPPRAEPIIGNERDGLLRRGHVLLVNAPSKAGKSWLLDELGVCMSAGLPWLGYECKRLPVLFTDFELDRPSFYHRLKTVADAMGGTIDPSMIDTLSLRGHTASTEALTDHIIEEASIRPQGYYGLLLLDPLYLFGSGDENSAGDVRDVMRQVGRLATALGCSIAMSHHDAKGAAGAKNAIDRASGSGVFARFPDALLDLAEVRAPDDAGLGPEDTVWRLTATLREFRPQSPTTWVFQWPLHRAFPQGDEWPVVGSPEDNRRRGGRARADAEADKREGRIALIGQALDRCEEEGATPTPELVWGYFSELTDEDVQLSTFKSWLRPSRGQYPFASIRDGPNYVVTRTGGA